MKTTDSKAASVRGKLREAVQSMRSRFAETWQDQTREGKIRRDIENLHSLTDSKLHDMGISRLDIQRVVRYGKEYV